MRILICGLPGHGKSTLAANLSRRLHIPFYDGEAIRRSLGLGWPGDSAERVQQAHRMRALTTPILAAGGHVICSFVCPTVAARREFCADYIICVNRPDAPPMSYTDTNAIWWPPLNADLMLQAGDADEWAGVAEARLRQFLKLGGPEKASWPAHKFDPEAPTALLIGRFQPFHEGHKQLAIVAIKQHGQVTFGIRMMPLGPDNPSKPADIFQTITSAMEDYKGYFNITILPNIASVVYGRDVGYQIQRLFLPPEVEKIQARVIRAQNAQRKPSTFMYGPLPK